MSVTMTFDVSTFKTYLKGLCLYDDLGEEANDEYLATLSTMSRTVYRQELHTILENLSQIRQLTAENKAVIENLKSKTQQTLVQLQILHRNIN